MLIEKKKYILKDYEKAEPKSSICYLPLCKVIVYCCHSDSHVNCKYDILLLDLKSCNLTSMRQKGILSYACIWAVFPRYSTSKNSQNRVQVTNSQKLDIGLHIFLNLCVNKRLLKGLIHCSLKPTRVFPSEDNGTVNNSVNKKSGSE